MQTAPWLKASISRQIMRLMYSPLRGSRSQ